MTRDEAKSRVKSDIYQYADFSDNPNEDEFWQALDMLLEQEPSGDAISRQAALKLFATHDGHYLYEAIRDLPSVTPNQRTGHWIEHEKGFWSCVNKNGEREGWIPDYECSECGSRAWKHKTNYCPHCGAKMESEEQE